eukprot:3168778-Pleurochrysis_carterae.AAC.2
MSKSTSVKLYAAPAFRVAQRKLQWAQMPSQTVCTCGEWAAASISGGEPSTALRFEGAKQICLLRLGALAQPAAAAAAALLPDGASDVGSQLRGGKRSAGVAGSPEIG